MQKSCACRFLYGPETSDEDKSRIENSLQSKTELKLEVKFYKKNGPVRTPLLRHPGFGRREEGGERGEGNQRIRPRRGYCETGPRTSWDLLHGSADIESSDQWTLCSRDESPCSVITESHQTARYRVHITRPAVGAAAPDRRLKYHLQYQSQYKNPDSSKSPDNGPQSRINERDYLIWGRRRWRRKSHWVDRKPGAYSNGYPTSLGHARELLVVKHELMRLLEEREYACFEEVYCIDTDGSTRYADIVAFPKTGKSAMILDPTVRYEINDLD
ncbi:unnamed protein product [Nezara viridula]|uniref:Uncharacterized protein n=1 Tax=Nezara viridula TaxID=85310 RepID=A0A9P0HC95_NEZVI|nr:unnamed protein product [Nezara viridula]